MNADLFIPIHEFDWEYYLSKYEDLRHADITSLEKAYQHWITYGCHENRWVRFLSSHKEIQVNLRHGEQLIPHASSKHEPKMSLKLKEIPLLPKIAIMIHIFDTSMIPFFVTYLNTLSRAYPVGNFDLYLNIVEENNPFQGDLKACVKDHLKELMPFMMNCYYSENRGGDIGGLIRLSKEVIASGIDYRYVIFVHSKTKKRWRNDLCRCVFSINYPRITEDPKVGLISSKKWIYSFDPVRNKSEFERFQYHLIELCRIYQLPQDQPWQFVAGTMFLANIAIIQYLVSHEIDNVYHMLNRLESVDINWLNITQSLRKDTKGTGNDYMYRTKYHRSLCSDYMIEHTFERIIGLISQHLGLKTIGY